MEDKLADDDNSLEFLGYTSLQKELHDLGLDVTKSNNNPLDKEEEEIYRVKLEFTFRIV